jgi:hypothetical protein
MATAIRNPAQRLRQTVDALPMRTRVAMLDGIAKNRIIVGAYTDPTSGGICPMLAAHRNGGRTSLASFAIAWDAFTDAKRPRRATRREVRTLRSYLELSLLRDEQGATSIAELADSIRSERAAASERPDAPAPQPAEPVVKKLDRRRWAGFRVVRRPAPRRDLVTAAQEQLRVPR